MVPFSSYLDLAGALLWDRRRPRLHASPLRSVNRYDCRRGRLRSQKERARDSQRSY